jgi:hypothetical protein
LQAANKVLMIASHAYPSIRHCTRIGHTRRWRRIKAYFTSAPGKVRHSFSQDVALHGHLRQIGSQAADLHLLGGHLRPAVGAFQCAFPMSLDPVEQRLLNAFEPKTVRNSMEK